jgi:carbon-monoxide dehydrogenase large subunit
MNEQFDADAISALKFAVGQPVPRSEDPTLVRGAGRYTDDVNLPGQAYAAMVRSPVAHGVIRGIDTTAARAMPGVLAIYVAADLQAAGYGAFPNVVALKNRDGSDMRKPQRRALAGDRVRFVGDPVACVVAATEAQARDAAEAVTLDIEALPAVTTSEEALRPGAPQIYDNIPGNVVLDFHSGDSAKTEAAFAKASHVVKLDIVSNRIAISAMEPRAAIAAYDAASERFTFHVGGQGVFGAKNMLSKIILNIPPEKIRVVTGHVGGSFGMKSAVYPEYVCILHAARALGRPVKWTASRLESFLSDSHGREVAVRAELALDPKGKFLALRVLGEANVGAYLNWVSPGFGTSNLAKNAVGVYRTPVVEVGIRAVVTNTTLMGAYRGAGRPEANYIMERLIESAAAEMGIDSVALRRRNHIRPSEIPYATPVGTTYDSGHFATVLARALEAADWDGFKARKRESKKRGKLRGRGIGQYLEATAPANNELGDIRFNPDGTVTIRTGTLDFGQGHATPFAQVLAMKLGVPFEKIRLIQGDSDELLAGGGTGGSKSMMMSGTAIAEAADKVIEQGRKIAAVALEASADDIGFGKGRFTIVGTDRGIGIMELAARLNAGFKPPADAPQSLDVKHVSQGAPTTFPNGCHIAEVEVDPETGAVEVVRYTTVNDFGVIVNPMLVAGQVHGGVVQGIGQALMEHVVYDEGGQPVSASYQDYALPRAIDSPMVPFESEPSPATTNPLGVKGCGEAGCAGALPAVMNALVDALRERGIAHINMPATPQRVWQALQAAGAKS